MAMEKNSPENRWLVQTGVLHILVLSLLSRVPEAFVCREFRECCVNA